jgi:antitoxin component YwqK of YwqJK toxin-antitoxin module
MKKTLLIITLFITGVCFAQKYEGMEFYDNGKPKSFKTYKVSKGKIELVKAITWHENGQKGLEETYKDGKEDGLITKWYENGQKSFEGTYKDGKEDGLRTEWYENGQKGLEVTYKDGKREGLITKWYENGQKEYEVTFKNGKFISQVCWDEDENKCECSENWWEGCN